MSWKKHTRGSASWARMARRLLRLGMRAPSVDWNREEAGRAQGHPDDPYRLVLALLKTR
jgi:hypothetical protein